MKYTHDSITILTDFLLNKWEYHNPKPIAGRKIENADCGHYSGRI